MSTLTAANAADAPPPLVADGLHKRFAGNHVIRGFSLVLPRGAATGLVGANGAGKTTIFNLLSGELVPDEGSVTINGSALDGCSVATVARMGIGRTFQEVRLFGSLSVRENCALYAQQGRGSIVEAFVRPRRARTRHHDALARADEALEVVGLADRRHSAAADLSYADQKLLSIGRLLAMGAHTFLLDEPASGLDRDGIAVVLTAIRRLVDDGGTVLLIEHNLDVVRESCARVAFLQQGVVLADGTPENVFSRPELAEVYFGV